MARAPSPETAAAPASPTAAMLSRHALGGDAADEYDDLDDDDLGLLGATDAMGLDEVSLLCCGRNSVILSDIDLIILTFFLFLAQPSFHAD